MKNTTNTMAAPTQALPFDHEQALRDHVAAYRRTGDKRDLRAAKLHARRLAEIRRDARLIDARTKIALRRFADLYLSVTIADDKRGRKLTNEEAMAERRERERAEHEAHIARELAAIDALISKGEWLTFGEAPHA